MTNGQSEKSLQSCYNRLIGRSLVSIIFGTFFENKNNTAAIIGIVLVFTLCYVVVFREEYEYMSAVLNVVFVIIGYYFGAKQGPVGKDVD
jgi:hypothetical protein